MARKRKIPAAGRLWHKIKPEDFIELSAGSADFDRSWASIKTLDDECIVLLIHEQSHSYGVYMNAKQVKGMMKRLQHWLDTGRLAYDGERERERLKDEEKQKR